MSAPPALTRVNTEVKQTLKIRELGVEFVANQTYPVGNYMLKANGRNTSSVILQYYNEESRTTPIWMVVLQKGTTSYMGQSIQEWTK